MPKNPAKKLFPELKQGQQDVEWKIEKNVKMQIFNFYTNFTFFTFENA